MNTFDDDSEQGFFDEPRRRPPRRRPQRSGPRRPGPSAGSTSVFRLAGLIALALAIAFGLVLACSGQSKADYSAYINAMKPLATDSATVGDEFATALSTPNLTMQSFQADLAGWLQREKTDYLKAQRLRPPGPLQSAHAEALATFQLRYRALDGIASTLLLAQSKHDSASVAAAALASEAQLLSASDIVWEQLYKLAATQTLTDQKVTDVIVPASQIVTNPDIVSARSLSILYQRVGTPASGGHVTGIHGSNLDGTNAVENGISKALSKSTQTTVTAGSGLVIDVVFDNSGAYPEVQIPVTLTVTVSGHSVYTQTETVPQIAAGERTTVSFGDLQLPNEVFGASATLSVSIATVKGEARRDNNEATYPVLFLLPPS